MELTAPTTVPVSSGLPSAVRALIAAAAVAIVGTLSVIGVARREFGPMTAQQWTVMLAVTALAAASSVRPLLLYRGNQSESFTPWEAFLVVLMMTQPPAAALAGILAASAVAQVVRKRPLGKLVFNVGQHCTAACAALVVDRSVGADLAHFGFGTVTAAGLGAVAYFATNSASVIAVLVAMGASWRSCLVDGLRLRLVMFSAGTILGGVLGVTLLYASWTLVLAVPGLLLLRHTVAAQFKAEHDRARVQGLFEATMETNQTLQREAVTETILRTTRELLRCPQAYISHAEPTAGLAAPISTNGERRWLVAAGRRREEPFEPTDHTMLDALAAVASGAATNAELYRQVRYERQRLASIAVSIGEGVVAIDLDGRVTFANAAASELVDLVGRVAGSGEPPASHELRAPQFLLEPARQCIRTRRMVREDNGLFPTRSGTDRPVSYSAAPIIDGGRPVGAVLAFRDVSERKEMEDELTFQARHDSLTGLANRRLLVDRLETLLSSPAHTDRMHAVIFVDVDRFKGVNDSLGHASGDDLLVAVSGRISGVVGGQHLVARFGGDEFVVLLEDIESPSQAMEVATRICEAVERPITLADGYELVATVSVGVALSAPDKSGDDLLHDADVAMYEAKVKRHGRAVQLFDHFSMGRRSAERLQLEAELRRAVERREIEVYYQPLFRLDDRRIVGAEALARWRHPKLGLLQPGSFIGLAEETGLIVALGRNVFEQAAQQVAAIRHRLGLQMSISVNVSPRQFHHTGLLSDVRSILAAADIEPAAITVEITESMVMDDLAGAREVMDQLHHIGVKIAVDDFGTGHSSLGYLKQFPVQVIKIDRSFVTGIAELEVDGAIVRAVIQLADAMHVLPVAEGIETAEQLAALERLHCPVGQGYHLARPMPADELLALLVRQREGTDLRREEAPVTVGT